jgi:ribosomal protein S3AE
MTITKNDALNLIDALNEWYEIVAPKELEKNEIGLNIERYENVIFKLHLMAGNIKKDGNKIIVKNKGVN